MQMTQIAILLLFENQDVLKLSEIHELLQLDNDQLKIHINNLVKSELLLTNGDVCYLIIVFYFEKSNIIHCYS